MTTINIEEVYSEAISHCRWKTTLRDTLQNIDIEIYRTNSFKEIFTSIYNICKDINGLGLLSIYDISSSICKYHNIIIDKVYIIGDGPKRAIELLHLNPKIDVINDNIKLKYVEIHEIIDSFQINNYNLDERLLTSNNGDTFESYLCNWQKNI